MSELGRVPEIEVKRYYRGRPSAHVGHAPVAVLVNLDRHRVTDTCGQPFKQQRNQAVM